jgi:hypothetical protein
MPDPQAQPPAHTASQIRPRLSAVELLRFLGSLRGESDLIGYVDVEAVIWWTSLRFHELTGIPQTDIMMTIVRLASNESLDGRAHMPEYGPYGEWRPELSHVAGPLHQLDNDGSTARIWRDLCRKWPFFDGVRRLANSRGRTDNSAEHSLSTDQLRSSVAETQPAELSPKQPLTQASVRAPEDASLAALTGQTTNEPHVNGLEGGRWLWWENAKHDIPRGTIYRLLDFMWGRTSASYAALEEAVFESSVEPQTVRSYANKANNALPSGFPWRLSVDSTSRQISKILRTQSR